MEHQLDWRAFGLANASHKRRTYWNNRRIDLMKMMNFKSVVGLLTLSGVLAFPVSSFAQTEREHREAQRAQDAHDKRHHNTAKVVGGSAAGGAIVGGLLGGGKGAVIGGAAGAGGGLVADKVRKHQGVKKRERRDYPR
jgi:uncharacterized protein YcfJ